MLKKFKTLRMRSQISIFLTLVLAFVMGLVGLANLTQKQIFQYTSSATSEQIIFNSDLKQMGQASSQISYYIKQRHQRRINLIEHVAQFIYFILIQEQTFNTKYQIDPCVTKDEFKSRNYLTSIQKFCYQINGTDDIKSLFSDDEQGILLYNSLSILDQYGLIFNLNFPDLLQIVYFSNNNFESKYPFGLNLKDDNPKSQSWFINHVKRMKDQPSQFNFFSDVYQVQTNNISYQFSITQSIQIFICISSIINKNKEVFGILNSLLSVTDQDLFNIEHNILLINKNGQIIYNGLDKRNNISEIFYIYNQSITGFNYTDWNLIEERASKHKHQLEAQQYLTLYDKYSQEYVYLHCEKFEKENFTLIIYTNLSSIQMIQNQFQIIGKQFHGKSQIALFVTLSSGLFCCIICISIIKIICQPLVNLNQQISSHILTLGNNINKEIFKLFNVHDNSFDLLTKLNQKFQNFYDILQKNDNKKCEQCILFEKMKYNRKECNIDLNGIKLIIQKVPNNKGELISINDLITFFKPDDQLQTI